MGVQEEASSIRKRGRKVQGSPSSKRVLTEERDRLCWDFFSCG